MNKFFSMEPFPILSKESVHHKNIDKMKDQYDEPGKYGPYVPIYFRMEFNDFVE